MVQMVQTREVEEVNVEGRVVKRMVRRAQEAMKPLFWCQIFIWMGCCLGFDAEGDLHDSVEEGGCQGYFGGDVDVEIPDNRERHYEHHGAGDYVWDSHVTREGNNVHTVPMWYRLIPCVCHR